MGERLDRAIDLLERLVCAMERLAERDVRPQNPRRRPRQTVKSLDRAREIAAEKLRRKGGVDR